MNIYGNLNLMRKWIYGNGPVEGLGLGEQCGIPSRWTQDTVNLQIYVKVQLFLVFWICGEIYLAWAVGHCEMSECWHKAFENIERHCELLNIIRIEYNDIAFLSEVYSSD